MVTAIVGAEIGWGTLWVGNVSLYHFLGDKAFTPIFLIGHLAIPFVGIALGIWILRRINRRRTHEVG